MKHLKFIFALFALLSCASPSFAASNEATPLIPKDVIYPTDTVSIVTPEGAVKLTVEVATTTLQIEHGLMFRKELAPQSGMLFLLNENAPINFWMKNTLIPLDILFIDSKGKIINIAYNTMPESTELIPSGGAVTGVLELAAGVTKQLHIAKGDKVVYPHFHE